MRRAGTAVQTLLLQARLDLDRAVGAVRPHLRAGVGGIEHIGKLLTVMHRRVRRIPFADQLVRLVHPDMVLVAVQALVLPLRPARVLVLLGVLGSTQRVISIRSASSRVRLRTPRPSRRYIDNLIERGLDPAVPRLFIIDSAKALSKAIRRTFGHAAAIQRCQVHKARNIIERLPKSLHASVRRALRQAWELNDADQAEKLIRNLARRLERDWSGVAGSLLEGIEEILTVTRLGLPKELRRSLACTNIVENLMGHGAPRLPQREAMALGLDGDPLDRSRYAGSGQRLPATEGSQATSSVTCRSGSTPERKLTPRRPCSPNHRRVTSTMATAASQCSTKSGTSPIFELRSTKPYVRPLAPRLSGVLLLQHLRTSPIGGRQGCGASAEKTALRNFGIKKGAR